MYIYTIGSIEILFLLQKTSMKKPQQEPERDDKEIRRNKIQEKNIFKEEKTEPTISHSLKKEFKKKKQEIDEEEWEEWDRFYNR